MQSISHLRQQCTYCKYGLQYKKDTDIWSNIELKLAHCDVTPCSAFTTLGHHPRTAQQSPSGPRRIPGTTQQEANSVPIQLLRVLINAAMLFIKAGNEKIAWM